MMGNAILALGIAFILLGSSALGRTSDDAEFQHIQTAFRYWFKEPNLVETLSEEETGFGNYTYLGAIAFDAIFNDPNSQWKVYRTANYDWQGKEAPVLFQELALSSTGQTKKILTAGYYFIYRGSLETGARLVAQPTEQMQYIPGDEKNVRKDFLRLYYPKKWATDMLALKVQLHEYLDGPKNIFRHNVLEFALKDDNPYSRTLKIEFLKNVDELKIKWSDLILDPWLFRAAYESTEGFLKLLKPLTELGFGGKKGVLLHGPPGTGKSLLGQILISSLHDGELKSKATFILVTARHLTMKHSIKVLFEEAVRLAPTVIFMEDIDLLGIKQREPEFTGFPTPGTDKAEVLNEFLNAIDGVVDTKGLLVVGTTNRVKSVDGALLRSERLGVHLYFGLPKYIERKEFFLRLGKKKAEWANDVTAEWLAGESEGMSGADIVEVIGLAKQFAFSANSFQGDKLLLTRAHFEEAFRKVRPGQGKLDRIAHSSRSLLEALKILERQEQTW